MLAHYRSVLTANDIKLPFRDWWRNKPFLFPHTAACGSQVGVDRTHWRFAEPASGAKQPTADIAAYKLTGT
jgi:hypothetical protein